MTALTTLTAIAADHHRGAVGTERTTHRSRRLEPALTVPVAALIAEAGRYLHRATIPHSGGLADVATARTVVSQLEAGMDELHLTLLQLRDRLQWWLDRDLLQRSGGAVVGTANGRAIAVTAQDELVTGAAGLVELGVTLGRIERLLGLIETRSAEKAGAARVDAPASPTVHRHVAAPESPP